MKQRRPLSAPPRTGSIVITVHAKPRSPASGLERQTDGTWVAKLVSLPVDGKANEELVRLVARQFGCAKAAVSVKSGASGRVKRVRITSVPITPGLD